MEPPPQRRRPPMKRQERNVFVKSVVYGSVSRKLSIPQEQYTHTWNAYLRPYDRHESMNYISKVVFNLHETCDPPVITTNHPPFEISQLGWGEFTIKIDIYLKDKSVEPVRVYHNLRHHHDNPQKKGPVVHEQYDELIFKRPNPNFRATLEKGDRLRFNRAMTRLSVDKEIRKYGTNFKKAEVQFIQNSERAMALLKEEIQKI